MTTTDAPTPFTERQLEARVDELLLQLTIDEKASLTGGDDVWHLPAVERLGIGRLKMSDGPSGVRGERFGVRRSLSFPCGMAVGATWDTSLLGRYGAALAAEARAKGVHLLLGPTVCIPRTPLAGRTFESFSEDPHLSARLTVAYVRGVQGEGVGCCVKHFAANDQEHERMTISAEVDEVTLREVHLPSFEAAVVEAGAWSVMSAYNRVNGTYCGEHPWLLGEVLKGEWGFDGVVVSDWFGTHSTAEAAIAGLDVEMPGPPHHLGHKLAEAVARGDVPEAVLDDHARRILRLAARTGVLDEAPARRRGPGPGGPRSARHRPRAGGGGHGPAPERGDPPARSAGTCARWRSSDPTAIWWRSAAGGSSQVVPHRRTSFLAELRERLGDGVDVVHERGCSIDRGLPELDGRLLDDGIHLEYVATPDLDGVAAGEDRLWTARFVALGDPIPGVPVRSMAIRGQATFRADTTGTWELGIANAGRARLLLDGEVLVDNTTPQPGSFFYGMGSSTVSAHVELVAGEPHELGIELVNDELPVAGFAISAGRPPVDDELGRAVAAASGADVAVVVVGSNSQWETEGADRADLRLVAEQDELVRAVAAANPRTVVVVNAGAPVAMPWADDVAAVVMLWYPGEEGGAALADVVAGLADPGGRLPITFPAEVEDIAAHGWYPGDAGTVTYGEGLLVGYRHADAHGIEPRWCFGHGLSFTCFELGEPTVAVQDGTTTVELEVRNAGPRRGTEVVQVYVGRGERDGRPLRELRGVAKVELEPGAATRVAIDLDPRSFERWDAPSGAWVTDPGIWTIHVGRSSRDLPHQTTVDVP